MRDQDRQLQAQLERVAATNPFYVRRWEDAGVDPAGVTSVEHLRDLPFTVKDDLLADQADVPPYGLRLGIDPRQVHEITMTSGTSGKAKEVHAFSKADARRRGELTATGWRWAGLRPGDAAIAHVGANNAASLWCMVRGIRSTGRMPYLVGHASFDERLDLMQRFGVDLMFAMPSALTGLAARCEELSIDPRRDFPYLRAVMTSGESWPVEWVERMEDFWGIRVFEVYGSTQTHAAYGASCCEQGAVVDGQRAHNHLLEWASIYEILDPVTHDPTPPGERGELVITHLDREASPLVRFRTGDIVRWFPAGSCPCGRPLRSLETGTIGRADDMLKIRGQNVWTSSVDTLVLAHPEIDELQVELRMDGRGRDVIDMRLAFGASPPADVEGFLIGLAAELKAATDLRFDLRVVGTSELPHFDSPDRKARRWTDRRHDSLAGS
jgi:phenylacetate-CoA ligase